MTVNPGKLAVPAARAGTLGRPRLDELLDEAARKPLTVLQAAAGYGKTTAVTGWLANRSRPAAWLSLDAHDDGARLLSHLIGAFSAHLGDPELDPARAAVDAGSDPMLTCLPLLADAVRAGAPADLVMVLDDYQCLPSSEAQEIVAALVDMLAGAPPVLIISRTPPELRLARRIAAREAVLIEAEQLVFTAEESARLLNEVNGHDLSGAELAAVDAGLAGWPVGLGLLALSLERRPEQRDGVVSSLVSLSAGELVDYVTDEMVANLGLPERRMWLFCSVVEQVNGPLAAALLDDVRAPELLERMRRSGHFVASDGTQGGWLRIHDLIRETLLAALERQLPGARPALHLRASRWFEQQGMLDEAFQHAAAAGDSARADELLAAHGLALTMARQSHTVALALGVPPSGPDTVPLREVLDLLAQFLLDTPPELAARCWELHERYAELDQVNIITSILVGTPWCGTITRSLAAVEQALARYGHIPMYANRIFPGQAGCLAMLERWEEVRSLAESALLTALTPGQIYAHAYLARVCLTEDDDPATAEWHVRRALELLLSTYSDTSADFVWVRAVLADVLRARGALEEARVNLDLSLSAQRRRSASMPMAILLTSDAGLAVAEGRLDAARDSIARARRILAGYADVGRFPERLDVIEAALGGG